MSNGMSKTTPAGPGPPLAAVALGAARAVLALVFAAFLLVGQARLPLELRFGFAVFALADGLLAVAAAGVEAGPARRWLGLDGVAGVGAAAIAWLWLPLGASPLRALLGGWAVADGLLRVAAGATAGPRAAAVQATSAVAFGLFMLSGAGAARSRWVLTAAAYAILLGILTGVSAALGARQAR
jgi:hypothetical protein